MRAQSLPFLRSSCCGWGSARGHAASPGYDTCAVPRARRGTSTKIWNEPFDLDMASILEQFYGPNGAWWVRDVSEDEGGE